MSWLHSARKASGRPSRRGATALVVAAGLVLGAVALVPTAGADEIGDKQAEAAKVADQLDALQSRQMDISAQAQQVAYEKSQAEDQAAEAQRLLDQTNADLETKREAVRTVAVEAYQNGNDSPELDAFLTSDANAGLQKRSYLETRTSDMRDAVDSLAAAQKQAEDDKARLDAAQDQVNKKVAEIAALKSAADKAVADQQAVNTKVQGELSSLVAAEQQRRAAAAKAASDAAAARVRRRSGPPLPPPALRLRGPQGRRQDRWRCLRRRAVEPQPAGRRSRSTGAIAAAQTRIGVGDYVWGASGPTDFDCSGLVAWAYAQAGRPGLPHYSGAQYAMTTRISRSQLQPGDLVFWGGGGSEHVAIYMGGNSLIHAFGSGGGVNITPLDGWWKPATGYGRLS